MKIFFLFFLGVQGCCFGGFISEEPVAVAYTPKRAYSPATPPPLMLAERARFSTSSGVIWLPGDSYLMTVNVFDSSISTYWFDKTTSTLEPIWSLGTEEGIALYHPENIDLFPDGNSIALSICGSDITFYTLDSESSLIYPTNVSFRHSLLDNPHGIAISSNGLYLAYTSIDTLPCTCVYKNIDGAFQLHQVFENQLGPIHPKGVAFSPDNRFLAISYCNLVGAKEPSPLKAQLEIHPFDANSELFTQNPISVFQKQPGNMETVKFSRDGWPCCINPFKDSCFASSALIPLPLAA